MTLEKRDGDVYYYRSVRDGERVRKVYIGAGELARIAHEREIMSRGAEEAARKREREDLERLEALAAPLRELDERAEALTRCYLVAAGYRRHKGQWRLARG
jgi:hypothetical protein